MKSGYPSIGRLTEKQLAILLAMALVLVFGGVPASASGLDDGLIETEYGLQRVSAGAQDADTGLLGSEAVNALLSEHAASEATEGTLSESKTEDTDNSVAASPPTLQGGVTIDTAPSGESASATQTAPPAGTASANQGQGTASAVSSLPQLPAAGRNPQTDSPPSGKAVTLTVNGATIQAVRYEALEEEVLAAVNQLRLEASLTPLTTSEALTEAAMQRCAELPSARGHNRPDGSKWYTAAPAGTTLLAEHYQLGAENAQALVDLWQESPGHGAHLLDPALTQSGLACLEIEGRYHWLQLLGA